MKLKYYLTLIIILISFHSYAQGGWTQCNSPFVLNRIDDLFMLNNQTGYAVSGDGQIMKTIDGGNNWNTLLQDTSVYCRSVEFITTQKGFVGGFPNNNATTNILRETTDGGATWNDLTPLIDQRAWAGICGLCAADSNTIYGCGNWYQDSAYIVKSIDGGSTWSFIDMHSYAGSLIDFYFMNKDTGFVTGCTPPPLRTALILYTTDGGISWTTKFQNTIGNEYCWKIQHQSNQIYYASIEDLTAVNPRVLKSIDGGMTWSVKIVSTSLTTYDIEGIGFIDSLKGWTGGNFNHSYETNDGGTTWTQLLNICPEMNRVFKVNDSLILASGYQVWKYTPTTTGINIVQAPRNPVASIINYPNPVVESLTIVATLNKSTHVLLLLFDEAGKEIKSIDNSDKTKGEYKYTVNTKVLAPGNYYLVLKTHEDKSVKKIVVNH